VYSHFSIDEHRAGPVSRLSKMTIHRAGPVYSLVLKIYQKTVGRGRCSIPRPHPQISNRHQRTNFKSV